MQKCAKQDLTIIRIYLIYKLITLMHINTKHTIKCLKNQNGTK